MFMSIEDIKKWLNDNGYYLGLSPLSKEPIVRVKTSNNIEQSKILKRNTIVHDYFNGKKLQMPTYNLLIDRINNNIGNVELQITKKNIPITKIDFDVIRSYNLRNNEIKENQALKEQLDDVDYIFTHSKKFDRKKYYVIRNNKCIEIHSELVDYSKKMLEVDFISRVNNALRDDETNTFKAEYDLMMRNFDNLGIMEKTEQEA